MDLNLRDKVAIVTGGASGIGAKIAEFFAQEGVKVLLADIQEGSMNLAVSAIRKKGGSGQGFFCDVTDGAMVAQMVKEATARFGTIDILVNSAGVGGVILPLETAERAKWKKILAINLEGTIECCRAIVPVLKAKGSGRIINIASEAGVSGEKGLEVYAASKGGVIALTKSLAKEMGRYNVTVNAVAPAFIHTPMTSYITPEVEKKWLPAYPLRRLGQPEDVANMVVFLCSDRCSWITGQTISINGGFSMR